MKNSIHTKKLKQKERIVLILTVIILVGLTYVLLTQMKNSYPFNTNQNYVLVQNMNTSINNIKSTSYDKGVIFGVLAIMTLITIKLRKDLNQI
jgi:cell division protein YceG involved in septum cleavage